MTASDILRAACRATVLVIAITRSVAAPGDIKWTAVGVGERATPMFFGDGSIMCAGMYLRYDAPPDLAATHLDQKNGVIDWSHEREFFMPGGSHPSGNVILRGRSLLTLDAAGNRIAEGLTGGFIEPFFIDPDGTCYFQRPGFDSAEEVYAVDPISMAIKWVRREQTGLFAIGSWDSVITSSAVLEKSSGGDRWRFSVPEQNCRPIGFDIDGSVIVQAFPLVDTGPPYPVRSLDVRTGAEHWRMNANQEFQRVIVSTDRIAYTGVGALDIASGAELWHAENLAPCALTSTGVLYAYSGQAVIAMDRKTGEVFWRFSQPGFVGAPVFGPDGTVYVSVDNKLVAIFGSGELIKPEVPVIETEPRDTTVTADSPAQFSVYASGTNLTYTWYLNGDLAQRGTNKTFRLDATGTNLNGSKVWAEIGNSFGTVTSRQATLRAGYRVTTRAPGGRVTRQPEGEIVPAGTRITLTAESLNNRRLLKWSGSFESLDNPVSFIPASNVVEEAVFEKEKGDVLWRQSDETDIRFGPPCVSTDGTLITGAADTLAAWDQQTGDLKWRFFADRWFKGFYIGVPVALPDNGVFLGTSEPHQMMALDAETGKTNWLHLLGRPSYGMPEGCITESGTLVVAATSSLFGIEPRSGRILWQTPVEGRPQANPVVSGETVFVPWYSVALLHFRILSLDGVTGAVLWNRSADFPTEAAVSLDKKVVLRGDTRTFVLDGGSGETLFEMKEFFNGARIAADNRYVDTDILAANAIITLWDHALRAVDASSKTEIWSVPGPVFGSMTLTEGGNLFHVQQNQIMGIFAGLAPGNHPWPMYAADAQHSGRVHQPVETYAFATGEMAPPAFSFFAKRNAVYAVEQTPALDAPWIQSGSKITGMDNFIILTNLTGSSGFLRVIKMQ